MIFYLTKAPRWAPICKEMGYDILFSYMKMCGSTTVGFQFGIQRLQVCEWVYWGSIQPHFGLRQFVKKSICEVLLVKRPSYSSPTVVNQFCKELLVNYVRTYVIVYDTSWRRQIVKKSCL